MKEKKDYENCYENCTVCDFSHSICSKRLQFDAICLLLHSEISDIEKALDKFNATYTVKDHDDKSYRKFELVIEFKSKESLFKRR